MAVRLGRVRSLWYYPRMKTNDLDEQTVTEIAKLLQQTKQQAFAAGYAQGVEETTKELRAAIDRVLGPKPVAETEIETTLHRVENIEDAVSEGLKTLAADLPQGVEPQALAEFLPPLDVKQVRAALRQLTMTGEAHRVADGRYLPGAPASAPVEAAAQ
jgi:flagellar biosynthesis/type III secretory pathway protein FliH